MAVTRIKNNQITDSTIVANAKVVDYSISASKLANNLTYGSNFTVSGNLTVNGTTTTVDTFNTLIQDPILVLADGQTSGTPVVDIGILGYRGSENSSFIGWKESASTFMAILSNTTASNTTVNVTSYANFTASTITTQANLSVIGNVLGNLNATSYVNAGNVTTPGLISATGNITGGNVSTAGLITATGNITGGNLLTAGIISTSGNVYAENILNTAGNTQIGMGNGSGIVAIYSAGNATQFAPSGVITLGGASQIVGGTFGGSGFTAGTSQTDLFQNRGGNVTVQLGTGGTIANTWTFAQSGAFLAPGAVSAAGNVTGGNILTAGLISAGGNITSATNVNTPNVVGATGITVSTGSGDLNLSPAGNIVLGNRYINGVAYPQASQDAASKLYVDNAVSTQIAYHQAVVVATTANLASTTGGTITYTQPNGAANGVGALLTTTGSFNLIDSANVQTVGTRILVKNEGNAVFNGVYTWANATNIIRSTDADQYGPNSSEELSINDYFFVSGGTINEGSAWIVDAPSGTITFGTSNIAFAQFSQSQVYEANTSAGLSLVGTTFSAKVDNNTTAFDGGGNISVKAGANLTTPNIGAATGTSLSVTGNIDAGTTIVATGNITGGNVLTGGLISATGTITSAANITGGNILTGGLISSTGNITTAGALNGATLSLSGNVTSPLNVTGNVTGGNVLTPGVISATANITGGNILTGGLISATSTGTFGNITVGTDSINSANGRITVNSTSADTDIAFNGDTVANVFYIDAGTGTASFGNSTQTTNAIVAFNSPTSVLMPVGNTAQRPGTGVTGMIRFNTNNNALEIYDNAAWTDVGVPVFTVIADQQFNGDGSTVAFTLSSTQTTNSCIVSINGVVQIPSSAYSVAGTDPTCVLTFTEAPAAGDLIDVREITTTTTVTSISNSSGNAVVAVSPTANDVNITGDLMPTGNGTQSIGSNTNRFSNIWLTGNTITLGNTTIKNTSGNSIGFFGPDGTTPATIDAASVDTTQIASGTSNVKVVSSNGNVTTNVNGTSNVMVVSSTDVTITGNLTVTGNATLSGNILGDRIQNGTTQIDIQSTGGNANITVGGTSNVAVFATTGEYVTGLISVTGNIAGGSAGNIQLGMDTANIHLTNNSGSGNITFLTNFGGSGVVQVFKVLGTGTQGTLTNGDISLTGNITDTGVLTISTGSNGNINLAPNGTGNINTGANIMPSANATANIGSATLTYNTIFAKATSAQYADLAEKYTADAEYAPGTVVAFGGTHEVTLSTQDADRRVAGVVSTNPSYIMNGGLEGANIATVALTGRVPTKVTGTVAKGDLMVSNGDGTARAEADPRAGAIIGKALEDFVGTTGVIEVVIGRF